MIKHYNYTEEYLDELILLVSQVYIEDPNTEIILYPVNE